MIKIHLRSSIFQSFMISNLLILKWQPFQYNKKIRKNFMKKLPFFNTNLIGISITLRLAHVTPLSALFQGASHEIIWPPTTLTPCVHYSPQQHAAVQGHCVQSTLVERKLGRERPAQKSMCLDSFVGSKFAHHKL